MIIVEMTLKEFLEGLLYRPIIEKSGIDPEKTKEEFNQKIKSENLDPEKIIIHGVRSCFSERGIQIFGRIEGSKDNYSARIQQDENKFTLLWVNSF